MRLQRAIVAGCAALVCFVGAPALAQSAPPERAAAPIKAASKPAWNDLTPAQKEALGPLQSQWDGLDADRKRKWVELAARYPQLSPEGKQRFHERLPGFANLTPQQRDTARDNFRKAYELPLDRRQTAVEQYRQLPDDKKRELAEQARKAEANRRPTKAARDVAKGAARDDGAAPSRSAD